MTGSSWLLRMDQAEIVWRLRSVYDGAEVIDVLRQLDEEGFVRRRGTYEFGLIKFCSQVCWFLSDRRWYLLD
jgi:hypothetical protein